MNKEIQNKIDFINQKTSKKTGFSTPENYFKEIENDFFSLIATKNLSKENTYKVPTDYFNTIENEILTKLSNENLKKGKVISLNKKILRLIPFTAAASILLFICLNYFNTNNTYSFKDITEADISFWYENGYGNTNNEELAIVLDASDFDEDILSSINDESLEDYLNTIDNSTLLNEIQ